MSSPILPPNATALERAAAEALAELERVPVPLRTLWNPDTCPAPLLPYLAWAFSVDRWDPTWSESAKRSVVKAAFYVHQHKGTISALRRVVEPLGYLLEVEEWWQQSPEGEPGTFALRIGVTDTGITEGTYTEMTRLVEDAKPLTRHIVGLDLLGETRGPFYIGTGTQDGDITTVYPFIAPETDSTGTTWLGAGLDLIDSTTVYPQESAA
ncbi:phage tail protein I [Kushneria phosphatilytica]|uniref:Phage tail protein I n=1 Tax=Kushneria phosphatilytica TaxID=657387 RepID=A0A1S1NQY1_9GAMM|nr:phage tail protein I [Kushneria phosphatilytica]OHV11199.1 phage tail protein I [Kushneria phosphatilytica]QEL12228.1 phage tail protein I [Kushneria phosphatilytica]